MTRMDGRFIKPGSIPADRLDPEILIGGGGALPDGAVTPAKLSAALLSRFAIVTLNEPVDVAPDTKTLGLQLKDLLGQPLTVAHVIRITCDERAALTVGEHGQALSGDGSPDLIAQTNASGLLTLTITCNENADIFIAVGPTQLSPMLDCRTPAQLTFQQT